MANLIELTIGLDALNNEHSIEEIISAQRNELPVTDVLGLTVAEFSQLLIDNDSCLPSSIAVLPIEWPSSE